MADYVNISKIHSPNLEYKRQHLWVASIKGIDSWMVETADRPTLNLGTATKVDYITTYAKYQAHKGEWNDIKATFRDPINKSGSKIILDMALAQWNAQTGRSTVKSEYSTDMTIRMLTPDLANGNDELATSEIWTLHNAFFTGDVDFNVNPLNYTNTDVLKIGVTISYDFATQEDMSNKLPDKYKN